MLKLIGGCTKSSFGGECCQSKTKTATELLYTWKAALLMVHDFKLDEFFHSPKNVHLKSLLYHFF